MSNDGIGPVVIVGAGLGGTRTATGLRDAGYAGDLMLLSAENCLPYDRPPLSKAVVRGEAVDTTFHPQEFYSERGIDLRLGVTAVGLDPAERAVATSDSETIPFGALVVATGIEPRTLPLFRGFDNAHTFRTRADSEALVGRALPGTRALVVGAGFIGCEIAAGLRARGVEVSLVDVQDVPLQAVLGRDVGARIAAVHRREGVELLMGASVASVRGSDRVESVTLNDGRKIACDVVVIGIGSRPELSWLDGSGIDVNDGIVCDADGRTNLAGVWAVGDVSSWAGACGHARVEHWSNVGNQVNRLVPALMGNGSAPSQSPVHYFWSDQYDVKLQALGHVRADSDVDVVHETDRKFVAYYSRNGILEAVVGANSPRDVMTKRRHVSDGVAVSELISK